MTRCVAPRCELQATAGAFCATHAAAPSAQRGGWLSAAKRRPYDATVISPRLWIGAKPPFSVDLPTIDVLVMCARELQPARIAFHGTVIRCPLPDSALSPAQVRMLARPAAQVAAAVAGGKRVLVTCHMGRNRSALVIALSLHHLTTMSGDAIVEHIRSRRSDALGNPHFVALIQRIVGDGRPRAPRTAVNASAR